MTRPNSAAIEKGGAASTPATHAVRTAGPSPPWPAGGAGVEEFLQLLGRAVKQFHIYPATSPMCTEAIGACYKAFVALPQADGLVLRVTPHAFLVAERPIGAGTVIEQELVRRLHLAHVASLDIEPSASPRDFIRFCTDVIRCEEIAGTKTTFAELLADHGVESIVPRMAPRPEVLDVGVPAAPVWDLVEREKARREKAIPVGPTQYLYPPDKGWVRLDPATPADQVSLVDMALLVNEPARVAAMLLRLTDDDPVSDEDAERALERKFTDVATLFSALDGPVAHIMLGKLARAVLAIPEARRQTLLRETILPGLFDGRAGGKILRDFPDAALAEALCLLLDLETAAPEVIAAAMHRLELPADRRRDVASLVEEQLERRGVEERGGSRDDTTEQYARRLIKIDGSEGRSFAEFSAFDLSIDDKVAEAIAQVGDRISRTDVVVTQLDCLWRLVRLEPNPVLGEVFLRKALLLFGDLARDGRWDDLAGVASRFSDLAAQLRETRPDVADVIVNAMSAFCTTGRVLALLELHERDDEGREIASSIVEAFGASLAPRFIAILDDPALNGRAAPLVPLMCRHAAILAPALAAQLGRGKPASTRATVRACGFAGAGYESAIASQLTSSDRQTVREALRALARIGSPRAASSVAEQIVNGTHFNRTAAAEALWHFPSSQRAPQLRTLLRREFVVQHPPIASMLIDRAAQSGAGAEIKAALGHLEGLRFRFWSPSVMRVAWKARELRCQ